MAAIRSSLLLPLLALLSCRAEPTAPDIPAKAVAAACEPRRFEGSAFTICRYDRTRHEILFFLDGHGAGRLRSLAALEAELGPRAERLRFAMNAGMYDEQGGPIGLYVAEGRQLRRINRRRGGGNFHMLPNGVFQVARDGRVAIVRAAEYDPQSGPRWATQSGPMLVIGGALHPAIRPNGDSLHIRNGVGVADESTAWFAISEG